MEQEYKIFEEKDLFHYKVQYYYQDVSQLRDYQDWYNNATKYVEEENNKRGHHDINPDTHVFTISFCEKCCSYSICFFEYEYSYVTCSHCQSKFCIGCHRPKIQIDDTETFCLKGLLKLLYIRTINRRAGVVGCNYFFNIVMVIISILFTPSYFYFIVNYNSYNIHPNINSQKKRGYFDYLELKVIYGILGGIVMIPYILPFLPIAIIILIPAIFSRKYYFTIAAFYSSLIDPMGIKNMKDI